MAKRPIESENHWPGYVDALSTIVMVVTFLLILLGIVIFVISQNIAKDIVRSGKVETEQRKQSQQMEEKPQPVKTAQQAPQQSQQAPSQSQSAQKAAQAKQTQPAAQKQQAQATPQDQQMQTASQSQTDQQAKSASQNAVSPAAQSGDQFQLERSQELTHDEKIESDEKLAVRSRKNDDPKKIVVASEEAETDPRKVKVTSAEALLTLNFEGGIKIPDEASTEIKNYMAGHTAIAKDAQFEVRAFSNAVHRSISEARRLAYYRALAVRNQLLALGVDAGHIVLKVGPSDRKEDAEAVKIYLK